MKKLIHKMQTINALLNTFIFYVLFIGFPVFTSETKTKNLL